ncbi:MAG: hypothetical protein WAM30_08225, partial [Candidatus Dormiibacterota bacterium]
MPPPSPGATHPIRQASQTVNRLNGDKSASLAQLDVAQAPADAAAAEQRGGRPTSGVTQRVEPERHVVERVVEVKAHPLPAGPGRRDDTGGGGTARWRPDIGRHRASTQRVEPERHVVERVVEVT